jgi:N-acetylglucosaminyl-diphospho-decaprenol L-rhamnosyltransferase
MDDVSVVVVTYDALPWLTRALDSVRGHELVVVDHGSTDDTLGVVRSRYPEALVVQQDNKGYGAGLNAGMRVASGKWFLLLNSDAWADGDAVERLVSFAEAHPSAAVVGPRLRNTDGTLQRSVRGFPSLWRLATEYLFLRKLAPGSNALNAFYGGGFDHDTARAADWLYGPVLLVRREAVEAVGPLDEDFFMFSEETDWCRRFWDAGWEVWFTPDAEFTHVGGATHGGRLFQENVRSHLRFFAKHRGMRDAERLRRLLLVSLRLRALLYRGERGREYRRVAGWLGGSTTAALLR